MRVWTIVISFVWLSITQCLGKEKERVNYIDGWLHCALIGLNSRLCPLLRSVLGRFPTLSSFELAGPWYPIY